MDSQFQVKITADISELQSRLKSVEAITGKFKDAMDGAASATKNMEQNANRGRMVAFAFGQVIRDAGFFANSFSLGVLAISNNIPILIDQLTLSVKALQPFAGYITIASSALTAALTIWAYTSQAVEKNTDSLEEYTKTLDAKNKAQLKGVESSASELTTLRLLYEQTQNTTLSLKTRKDAVDQLQELYPKYFANLSDEAILAGQGAKNYAELTNNIIASAKARGGADIIAENTKEEYLLQKRITDAKAAQAELDKQKKLQQQIYQKGSEKETREAAKQLQSRKLNNILNAAAIADIDKIGAMQLRLNQLKGDDAKIQELINKEVEKGGSLTEDFGKGADEVKTYASVMQALNDEFQKLEFLFTGTFGEKQESRIKAIQSAIEDLRKIGFSKTSQEIKTLSDELSTLINQQLALDTSKNPLKTAKVKSTTGGLAGAGALITDEDLQKANAAFGQLTHLWNILYGAINTAKEAQDQFDESMTKFAEGAVRVIGGELTNAFTVMLETGTLSFKGIFQALGQMVKRLLAAVLAASLLSAILSSFGIGIGKAKKGDFGGNIAEIMKFMTGATFAKGGIVSGPTLGLMGEYPGARSNPEVIAPLDKLQSILGTSGSSQVGAVIAETRVSGNDLAILIKRADRNRNGNY